MKYADVVKNLGEESVMDELKHLTDGETQGYLSLYPGPMDYPGEQRRKSRQRGCHGIMRCLLEANPTDFTVVWKRRMSH